MSNPNSDHWKRLAAELGLEMEPEPVPETPPPTELPPDEPAEEIVVSESSGIWVADSHSLESLTDSSPPFDIDEDEFEPEPPPHTEFAKVPPPDEVQDEKPRRRRRRSRRKKGDEPAPAAVADSPDEGPAEEHDDMPVELVKDWNIPSWNDLIASLYRPDR